MLTYNISVSNFWEPKNALTRENACCTRFDTVHIFLHQIVRDYTDLVIDCAELLNYSVVIYGDCCSHAHHSVEPHEVRTGQKSNSLNTELYIKNVEFRRVCKQKSIINFVTVLYVQAVYGR
jgi:hypothetical protein